MLAATARENGFGKGQVSKTKLSGAGGNHRGAQ